MDLSKDQTKKKPKTTKTLFDTMWSTATCVNCAEREDSLTLL